MPETVRFPALVGVLLALSLTGIAQAQPAPADHEHMLRQLIHDAAQGRIAYQSLSPGLAEAVRPQASTAQSELSALGALQSVARTSMREDGVEIYRTVFEKGALDWAFHVDSQGLIDNAIYRTARSDPG